MKKFTAFFLSCLLFSQAAFAQDFSSLDSDLQLLEDLIADTLTSTQEQQQLLHDLRQNLDESESIINDYESTITVQEILLMELQDRLNEMSAIYRMQLTLSERYEQRLKFWRNTTIIGIPAAALLSGVVVWAVVR